MGEIQGSQYHFQEFLGASLEESCRDATRLANRGRSVPDQPRFRASLPGFPGDPALTLRLGAPKGKLELQTDNNLEKENQRIHMKRTSLFLDFCMMKRVCLFPSSGRLQPPWSASMQRKLHKRKRKTRASWTLAQTSWRLSSKKSGRKHQQNLRSRASF